MSPKGPFYLNGNSTAVIKRNRQLFHNKGQGWEYSMADHAVYNQELSWRRLAQF